MKPIHAIIKRPILTEKSTALQEEQNTYCFEVDMNANKIEIRSAIEELFEVRVVDVHTCIVRGKVKRFGRRLGRRSNWKKAFVTLHESDTLNLLNPTQA